MACEENESKNVELPPEKLEESLSQEKAPEQSKPGRHPYSKPIRRLPI